VQVGDLCVVEKFYLLGVTPIVKFKIFAIISRADFGFRDEVANDW
jgi:hypothetical protein